MQKLDDTKACEAFRDALADQLDGDLRPDLAEHLADCDQCRDLRHEARTAARRMKDAGADFVPMAPEALVEKLFAALDARGTDVFAEAPTAAPTPTVSVPEVKAPEAKPEPAVPQKTEVVARPVAAPSAPKVVALPKRSLPSWAYGGIAAVGAFAAAALVVGTRAPHRNETTTTTAETPVTSPWQARVARIARPGGVTQGGLEAFRPGGAWQAVDVSADRFPAGTRFRTDPRTRARLDLSDGTVVVLDRASTVTLDPSVIRRMRLDDGSLVADVAHRSDQPARIDTANGPVQVLGTKFSLTATEGRTLVRVTRGVVKLGEEVNAVTVVAGQEGVAERNATPRVSPAIDLAGSVAWSELGPVSEGDRDAPLVGLGELRARRPGQTQERDAAVHLTSHSVKVRIVGNVARTEVEEVFHNDTGNELEGIYRFPVPSEAMMEDLALDVNGVMTSGSFVERSRAAAIWRGAIRNATPPPQRRVEEYVWVPGPWHDPALLEWQRGGRSELRVFPIPARGERRVRITFTQTLAPSGGIRRYVYPLPHDPSASTRVDRFDMDVQVLGHDTHEGVRVRGYPLADVVGDAPNGASRMRFSQTSFIPSGDLTLEYSLASDTRPMTAWGYHPTGDANTIGGLGTVADHGFVTLALRPELPRTVTSRPRDYVIAVDASRSMVGERWARASRLVGAIVAEMDPRDRITVLACDTRCNAAPGGLRGVDSDASRDVVSFLRGIEPAGASDLGGLVDAAVRAGEVGASNRALRVVYVGDGVATAGFRRQETLGASVRESLRSRPEATLTAVGIGQGDNVGLETLAQAGGGVVVPYVPGERLDAAALGVLEATYGTVLRDPVVTLPSSLSEVTPSRLPNLRAGGELLVSAHAPGGTVSGDVTVRGTLDGQPFEARYPLQVAVARDAGNAFVPRLYAAARVADLDASESPAARTEAIELSQRYRVSSRHTSLLVLESEAMFQAFGIDRSHRNDASWTGETAATGVASGEPSLQGAIGEANAQEESESAGSDEAQRATGNAPTEMRDQIGTGFGMGGAGYGAGIGHLGATRAGPQRVARRETDLMGDDATNERVPAARPTPTAPAQAAVTATPAPAPEPSAPAARAGGMVMARPMPDSLTTMARGRRGPGQWMRRVWVRRASVTAPRGGADFFSRVETARRNLLDNPDSRDRHRELYRWLSLSGELPEAEQVVERWMGRDPLDVDALQAKADLAARRGDVDAAIRTLSGVVDVRPDDLAMHERLVVLHARNGDERASCAHRVSAAEIRGDEAHLLAALGCSRGLRHSEAAEAMLRGVSDLALQGRLVTAPMPLVPVDVTARGELVANARWSGATDLDVVFVDPQGRRVSWMGGRTGITVAGSQAERMEDLGVSRLSSGDWRVEVVRGSSDSSSAEGTVTVVAMGERRSFPFSLPSGVPRAQVATVRVTSESQLVPVTTVW